MDNLPFNILRKYDDGGDSWLEDDDEWVIAYHGTGRNCSTEQDIFNIINSIFNNGFKNGHNNLHANHDDINHIGKK